MRRASPKPAPLSESLPAAAASAASLNRVLLFASVPSRPALPSAGMTPTHTPKAAQVKPSQFYVRLDTRVEV